MPYLTVKGQIGKRTNMRTKTTAKIVIPLFDYVVSNLNEAYFLSELPGSTGSKDLGYFVLILSGLLKKIKSE
jgi:hypothetical protein